MVGSDHDFDWTIGQFTTNAAERAAFANGQASRDAEVARLEAEVLRLRDTMTGIMLHMIQANQSCGIAREILARALAEAGIDE